MTLAVVAFLVAVAYVPGVPSSSLVGRWDVLLVGGAILMFRTRVVMTASHWMGLAFLAWCAAGLYWSYSPLDTLGALLHLVALAVVFCVAAETPSVEGVLSAYAAGIAVSAAFALVQFAGWQPVMNISDHPVGLFLSKNGIVEAALPVAVWALITKRWWYLWPALLCVMLSGSKEAVLMAVAAGAAWMIGGPHERTWESRAAGYAFALAGAGALTLVAVASLPESSTATLNERLAIWQASLSLWQLQPFGWGLGTYQHLLHQFEYAHDDYLQLLVETGPGVFLVSAILVLAVVRRGGVAERASLASLAAASLVWWPMLQPASGFLVALLAGHLVGDGARERRVEYDRRFLGRVGVPDARRPGTAHI